MYDIYDLPKSIPLGRQGEQYARAVEIDCAKMLSDYPGARLTLMQRRTRGETARIVKADVSDTGVITWSPDMDAMAVAGLGAIEIVATVDDKVAKSVIAATAIAPSLTPPDTDTQSGWVKDVLDASDAAQGAMAAAQESAAAAAGSAAAAQSSANAAAGSASAASASATNAAGSADAASGSASAAAQSAAEADTSAKASAASAAEAAGTLDSVKASADAAAASARAAAESASGAASSKSSAAQAATAAAGSASAASTSASDAAKSAAAASGSAAAAEASKMGAENAASAAKSEADKAAGSAAAAAQSATDAAGIIDDTVIAEGKAWSSKNTVDKLLPMQTVTGNPAVIETLEGYPLELSVNWEPKQEGSGTPSPDNVRPITGGRKSVTFTRAEDGVSRVVTLGETVYGGSVKSQHGQATWIKFTLDGINAKMEKNVDNYVTYFSKPLTDVPEEGQRAGICSHYQYFANAFGNGIYVMYYSGAYQGIAMGSQLSAQYATADAVNAYLAAQTNNKTAVQVAFNILPQEIKVEGADDLPALAGTNTISTDADTVTITAPTPPQTTASAAEAQAAKLDYVAMMTDVDVDDLTAVDDSGADTGMDADVLTDIEGSETDGKQEV